MAKSKKSVPLKVQYMQIAKRSLATTLVMFNAAVLKILAGAGVTEPTAKQWVQGAKAVSFPCQRCAGTGQYITQVVNGKPTGPGGLCYRCDGKGRQNDADRRRNHGYDNYAFGKAAHAMMGGSADQDDDSKCGCGAPATTKWNDGTPYCEECWEGRADGEQQARMEA